MPACLFSNTMAGIYQYNGKVSRRCSGYHVPGILNMSGCICNDELSLWSRKITVCHINGNALFALCFQSISKQSKVYIIFPPLFAALPDRFILVLKNRFGIVQQSAY